MRVRETVIRPFGNSAGVTLPKETLEQFGLEKGSRVFVRETPEGILLSPYDPAFGDAMAAYKRGANKYRNAMRELSRR
jgi:putative addiction module antidote